MHVRGYDAIRRWSSLIWLATSTGQHCTGGAGCAQHMVIRKTVRSGGIILGMSMSVPSVVTAGCDLNRWGAINDQGFSTSDGRASCWPRQSQTPTPRSLTSIRMKRGFETVVRSGPRCTNNFWLRQRMTTRR
eukprot:SAG25_NODE_148_length_13769_cov_14.642648_22_plen_132_part_00